MKRTLFALLLLAPLLPPSVSHADGPTTIDEFLEPGGRTRVIAHRGFSAAAPENTLAAVRAAIETGADMVEVDVTMSADRQLVVIHDDTLDRTTDGRGAVSELTLAELQCLDAGAWFAPRFAGERLPTLEAVLAEAEGRILLNVEIKSEAVGRGIVDKVAAAIRAHRMTDGVIVSSFAPAAIEQMGDAAPEIRTAVLFNPELHSGRDPVDIVRGLGASAFNIKRSRLTRTMLRRCREAGIPVAVYTVNSPRRLRKVVGKGVHAVFTDHPERLLDASGRFPAAMPAVLPSPQLERTVP
ncbi:MAG TPA: glycerophosphodiester phosphodiesterase family protein [Chondromyces sp.]|nr:glycerophosphodiester phosphodiesterase family protein [Chondromyces sp.]